MWVEANNAVRELNKSIDGNLTNTEKKTFIDAYRKDKRGILEASQNKLRKFIISDYSQRSYDLVWKSWVKAFQKFAKISPDWDYGPNTFRAIVQYQERNGLKVDGIIWSETLKAISWGKPLSQWRKRSRVEKKEETKTRSIFSRLFGRRNKKKTWESIDSWKERYNINISKAEKALKKLSRTQRKQLSKGLNTKNRYTSIIKALAIFQKVSWLEVDGVYWPATKRALRNAKKLPYDTPRSQKDIKKSNNVMQAAEKFWWIDRLRWRWKTVFKEFYQVLSPRERKEVMWGKPFSIVDSRSKRLLFMHKNKSVEMWVILWSNGLNEWEYTNKNRKTPVWLVHKFDKVMFSENRSTTLLSKWEPYHADLMPADNNNSWKDLKYNAKVKAYYGTVFRNGKWNYNKRVTVVGLSMQSDTSRSRGQKYFHLVGPNRNGTFWCVGIKYEYRNEAKEMARIMQAKRGFWYVSKS